MSKPLDLRQFPDLPAEVVDAILAERAILEQTLAELSEAQENADRAATLKATIATLTAHVAYLEMQLKKLRFGKSSEKLSSDQMELAFDELETELSKTAEALDQLQSKINGKSAPRKPRALPADLPRIERVISPDSIVCPCGCGDMVQIGEDRSERLDIVPSQYRVIVTIRPKYACPKSRAKIVQAKAPAYLLEGSWPTEATLAHVLVAKYSEHMPLYRQAQVMARHGVPISRSTLADWVGRASYYLDPIVDSLKAHLKTSDKLFMDETRAPVLDPGRGTTKTGYIWALARDDRPWNGTAPPGVVFIYAPGRGGAHAETMLTGFDGLLQVDAYGGYNRLTRPTRTGGNPVTLAYCWAHARRALIDAKPQAGSPIVDDALDRIAALYAIEKEIRGSDPANRKAIRQEKSRPLVDDLQVWLKVQHGCVSKKSRIGIAIDYTPLTAKPEDFVLR